MPPNQHRSGNAKNKEAPGDQTEGFDLTETQRPNWTSAEVTNKKNPRSIGRGKFFVIGELGG